MQSDIRQAMQDLKKQPGKNIWLYGGSGLITSFMNLDLVDEFLIAVYPMIFGAGKPLFKNIDYRVPLKLREVNPARSGAVLFTYERQTTA